MNVTFIINGLLWNKGDDVPVENRYQFVATEDAEVDELQQVFADKVGNLDEVNDRKNDKLYFVEVGDEIDLDAEGLDPVFKWAYDNKFAVETKAIDDAVKEVPPMPEKPGISTSMSVKRAYKNEVDAGIDAVVSIVVKFLKNGGLAFMGPFASMLTPIILMFINKGGDQLKNAIPYTDRIAKRVQIQLEA